MRERYYADVVAELREAAQKLFAQTEYRSALFLVAQYWADSADDELHTGLVASRREQPLWPHRCCDDFGENDEDFDWSREAKWDETGNLLPHPEDDRCHRCDWRDEASFYSLIPRPRWSFEPFIFEERVSNDNELADTYRPFALVRKVGDAGEGGVEVEVELVGEIQRPYLDHDAIWQHRRGIGTDPPPRAWLDDPRARALYDEICANVRDDGPRRVLADYLLEREHPHGELIALSLADHLDDASIARRDSLLEAIGPAWLASLAPAVGIPGAQWARGFVAHVQMHHTMALGTSDSAAAWRTVETLRFAELGSTVATAMTGLRQIETLNDAGVERLRELGRSRPWAIEKLAVSIQSSTLAALVETDLPALRELRISSAVAGELAVLEQASWWETLERLSVGVDYKDGRELAKRTGKQIAIIYADWECWLDGDGFAAAPIAWSSLASLRSLIEVVQQTPAGGPIVLRRSRHYVPDAADVAVVERASDRRVSIG